MPAEAHRPSNTHERACECRVRTLRIPWNLEKYQADCSCLQKIKKWKHKNPEQIDKVPEESAYFDTIRQMLRVALIQLFADRQPHVNEHQHAAEHVETVQPSDGKIAGKIRAVPWFEHRRVLHILFFDRCYLFRCRARPEVRPIHLGICWVCIERIQCDFVFLDVRIL